jgi:hypothetical protein
MKKISKKILDREVEKQLIPKLHYLGYFLIIFGLIFVNYAIFSSPQPAGQQTIESFKIEESTAGLGIGEDPLQESPQDILNLYMVAAVFAVVGASCIFIAWRKKLSFIRK